MPPFAPPPHDVPVWRNRKKNAISSEEDFNSIMFPTNGSYILINWIDALIKFRNAQRIYIIVAIDVW